MQAVEAFTRTSPNHLRVIRAAYARELTPPERVHGQDDYNGVCPTCGESDGSRNVDEQTTTTKTPRASLRELGFTDNEFDEWRAKNCTVTIYRCCGEYEIDIRLPNGSCLGFDVQTFAAMTAKEIAAAEEQRAMPAQRRREHNE